MRQVPACQRALVVLSGAIGRVVLTSLFVVPSWLAVLSSCRRVVLSSSFLASFCYSSDCRAALYFVVFFACLTLHVLGCVRYLYIPGYSRLLTVVLPSLALLSRPPPSLRPRGWLMPVANMIPPLVCVLPPPHLPAPRLALIVLARPRAPRLGPLPFAFASAFSACHSQPSLLPALPSIVFFSVLFLASRPSLSLALALALALARAPPLPFLASICVDFVSPRIEPLSFFFYLLVSCVGLCPLAFPPSPSPRCCWPARPSLLSRWLCPAAAANAQLMRSGPDPVTTVFGVATNSR